MPAAGSQDPANHSQALAQQRQLQRVEDKLSFQPPVTTLGVCPSWKAWAPGPTFGPLWPGTIATTFWRINELHSLHLAWLLSQACFSFPFWQRPLGPIQFKLPGQSPLPLNLEWKQKELVPLPSVESPDGGPGGEADLQNCPRPETPPKVMSLLVVSGGSGIKGKASPGLPQVGPPLTSTPQLQAGSELGDQGSVRWDCKGPEEGPLPAPPTGQGVPTAQGRPMGQGEPMAESVPDTQTVPATLEVPMAAAVPTAQTPPPNQVLSAAPKVPTAQMMPAGHTEPAAPKVPSAPTKPAAHGGPTAQKAAVGQPAPAAQTVPVTPKTPSAQKIPAAKTSPAGPKAPKAQTGPVAKTGSAAPKAPAAPKASMAPKASRAPKTPAAQKALTDPGPAVDAAKLLREAQPSSRGSASSPKGQGEARRQGLQPCSTVAPNSKHQPQVGGLLGASEGTPRQPPRQSQANSTVTSFQRYHEALNTPFELNLSGEPGNQGLRRVVIDGSSVAMV